MTKRAEKDIDRRSGEARPDSKLTVKDVIAIRKARAPVGFRVHTSEKRRTLVYLAKKYGVSATVISHVANRRTWKHVQ